MSELKNRNEISAEEKWQLAHLFADKEAWESEFSALSQELPAMAEYKGRLKDYETVKEALFRQAELMQRAERLFAYARMNRDTDNADEGYCAMTDKMMGLLVRANEILSYMQPELNLIANETLLQWAENPEMAEFDYYLREIERNKPHVLSDAEERLLALSGEISESYDTIYTMLSDVDMQFAPVEKNGVKEAMSHGRYGLYLEDPDRNVRREAFESMYQAYREQIHTVAALYAASVKKDVFYARARHFATTREAELFGGDIPVSVYDSLVEAIHSELPALHRYVRLRAKTLKLPDLQMYDMYVPMTELPETGVSFEKAKQLVLKALAPLGKEYVEVLERAYESGWVDVRETKGKTSGAYSWGVYGVHPYILLNYQDRLDDAFTLAHESGHAMHSYLSNAAQPYSKASYRIFVAEVASTVNEVLMLHSLLNTAKSEDMRKYLLELHLEQFRTTVFRQTMFAEFEQMTHERAEAGESLSKEWLCETYLSLNRAYYGEAVESGELISYEWARIPHFYNAFYVYQYATGFCAAVAIADRILKGEKGAVEGYLSFLSSGGSDSPINVLKKAGVDLSQPDTVRQSLKVFAQTLSQLEELLK